MLRDATIDDTEMLFLWRNSDEIRSMLFSQDVIAFETHKHWLRCGLDSSTKYLFIYEEAEPCGFAQLDRVSADRKTFEWGFYKAPSAPQGVGERMLRELLHHVFQSIGAQEVIGKVLTFNTVSMNLHANWHSNSEKWNETTIPSQHALTPTQLTFSHKSSIKKVMEVRNDYQWRFDWRGAASIRSRRNVGKSQR